MQGQGPLQVAEIFRSWFGDADDSIETLDLLCSGFRRTDVGLLGEPATITS